jgi:energy-coupling factor transport system substrate-specific component
MKGFTTKQIVATGIGAAGFIILSRFAAIPTGVPNTSIETAYAFLAFMAVLFGPVTADLIGLIGHGLKDAILYGSPSSSWVIVSGFVGFGIGLIANRIRLEEGVLTTRKIVLFNATHAIVQAIGWIIIAPVLDILIYTEPAD